MSGFVAIYHLDGAPADPRWLEAATRFMQFRGPDAQQWRVDGPVGLGCALLRTTFEAEHEQQPFSLDGDVWVVADARIDGRDDLIAGLRTRDRTVATEATDVELILHAYHAWGEACVEHLIGDFAFVVWDGRARRLFCARDHFGATPFYYAHIGNMLLISNTLNVLRLHPDVPDTLDESTIGEFLLFHLRPASDATTFAAIWRLRPAHVLTAAGGDVRVHRYWQPPDDVDWVRYRQPQEYVERFRALFESAVGDRLRTDRVGTALSGGMDSTSVAATAHRLLTADGRPFELRGATIAYRRLIPDQEEHFARQVADAYGFPTEVYVAEDYITREPPARPTHVWPEPWALPDLTAEEDINRHVADYARVLLMGFGGDPLMSASRASWGLALRAGDWRSLILAVRPRLGGLRRKWLRGHQMVWPFPAFLDAGFVARYDLRERWAARVALTSRRYDQVRGMAGDALWENLFNSADPGFTGVPVKARWPFFDLRLVNFILTVPPAPWCRKKHLLREAMCGILPESVRQRPKTILQGHPHYVLLQERGYPPWVHVLAGAPDLAGYVNQPALCDLLQQPDAVHPVVHGQVGSVVNLAYWLQHQRRPQSVSN